MLSAAPPPRDPIKNVNGHHIELLEGLLVEARAGETRAIVIVIAHPDGKTSDRWSVSAGVDVAAVVGAMELAKQRFILKYDTRGEEMG